MTAEFSPAELNWMQHALSLAQRAEDEGEVPVGAVVVRSGQLIAEGWNRVIGLSDPSAHAEIVALRAAGAVLGNYRLPECELYVTLEPCCMCVGALVHSRLARLIYGATDPKAGAAGGCFPLLQNPAHNHRLEVLAGCMESECRRQLRGFFQGRRAATSIGQARDGKNRRA